MMISRHCQTEAMRRDLLRQIPYSTDPERLRRLAGVHQFSAAFTLGLPIAGAILFTLVFYAAASV